MTVWLKQSTSVTLKLGPFLDETDGKTAETGLTVSQADVRLSKNGGNMAQKNESTSLTHDEIGIYDCPLDTTDTGTLGRLLIAVHESGALPVWQECMVVPANVWDSMFGADLLDVSTVQVAGSAVDADSAQLGVNVVNWKGSAAPAMTGDAYARLGAPAGASVSADVAAVKSETASILTDTAEIGAAGAGLSAVPWNAAWDAEVQSECADALTAYDPPTKAELDSGLAALNDFDPAADTVAHVTLVDTTTTNTDMVAAAPSAASVADAVWDESLAAHDGAGSTGLALAGATAPSAADVADAVWDEAIAGHADVGSTGAALAAAGGSGDPWATALPGAYGAGTAGKILGDNLNAPVGTVDTVVDAIKAKTDNLPASPAAVGSAMTLEAGAVTAAVIATDAIDGDAVAASAVTEIQSGLATAAALATVDTVVDAILVDTGTDIPAAIAGLPTDADVQTAAGAALTAYDPPTKAELDSGFAALNDVSAVEVGLEVDASLASYDGPTKAELDDAVAPLATAANVSTVAGYVDTEVAAVKAVTDKLDTAMELDVDVYRFTTNALEMSPAGEGGGATAEAIRIEMDDNSTRLASIDGKLASTSVTVQSPVASSGAITVHTGDDYDATHGRSLAVTVDDVPDLTDATVKLKCSEATWTGSVAAGDGTAWVVSFEPTAAQTAVLTKRTQMYEIEAELSDGDIVTLATGTLAAVRDIPEVV